MSLRHAIHAAFDDPGSDAGQVAELYHSVGDLALIVDRLPQLVRHLARRAEHLAGLGGLDTDDTIDETGRTCALDVAAALKTVAAEFGEVDAERDSPLAGAHRRLGALKIRPVDQ